MALSTIPDLDSPNSYVGRWFPWLSEPIAYSFGHRTLTHSLPFLVVVGLFAWPLSSGYWLALVGGVGSHLLVDMMTLSGVALFYPSTARCVLPGSARYRFASMSWAEFWLMVVLGLTAIPLLQLAGTSAGTEGIITVGIGEISTAREQYDSEKGSNYWTLRIKGRDNNSHQAVDGSYPVRGEWGSDGFLLDHQGSAVTICKSGCLWYADSAVLVKGDFMVTTSIPINHGQITAEAIREALVPYRNLGNAYLSGTLEGGFNGLPRATVSLNQRKMTLTYSALSVTDDLLGTLRNLNLFLQIRHSPKITVPPLVLPDEGGMGVQDLLDRWVNVRKTGGNQ